MIENEVGPSVEGTDDPERRYHIPLLEGVCDGVLECVTRFVLGLCAGPFYLVALHLIQAVMNEFIGQPGEFHVRSCEVSPGRFLRLSKNHVEDMVVFCREMKLISEYRGQIGDDEVEILCVGGTEDFWFCHDFPFDLCAGTVAGKTPREDVPVSV